MSVKSCIGMIECVLQQQAVQPVGVGKLKVRETLKAESFNSDSTVYLFLKLCSLSSGFATTAGLFDCLTSSDTFHSF